jgi:hypothetical protein
MAVFCVRLVIDQHQTAEQVVWSVRAGGMDRPSRTKLHPAGSLSSSQPGGPPCWASPLAFGLIVRDSGGAPSHTLEQCILHTTVCQWLDIKELPLRM